MDLSSAKIAIIGLGYVGLPLAVEFGKQRPVLGFDIHIARVAELQSGRDSTLEVAPHDLTAASQLRFRSSSADLKASKVFIITVATPVDQANRPDLTPRIRASEIVAGALNVGDVVVYKSTVYPGAREEVCVPVLARVGGLKFNEDFFWGYSPERINPGDKIRTLKKITSGSTARVAEGIDPLDCQVVNAGALKASSLKVAEAAKVIENNQRDLNIALVNEL